MPPGRARLQELILLETMDGRRIGGHNFLEEEEGRREGSSRGTAIREKRIIEQWVELSHHLLMLSHLPLVKEFL